MTSNMRLDCLKSTSPLPCSRLLRHAAIYLFKKFGAGQKAPLGIGHRNADATPARGSHGVRTCLRCCSTNPLSRLARFSGSSSCALPCSPGWMITVNPRPQWVFFLPISRTRGRRVRRPPPCSCSVQRALQLMLRPSPSPSLLLIREVSRYEPCPNRVSSTPALVGMRDRRSGIK